MSQEKSRKGFVRFGFLERLAATYSRRTYRTTTIGKTVFDGRVRNGIGSDHSFMATKNGRQEKGEGRTNSVHSSPGLLSNVKERFAGGTGHSLKTAHRRNKEPQFAS